MIESLPFCFILWDRGKLRARHGYGKWKERCDLAWVWWMGGKVKTKNGYGRRGKLNDSNINIGEEDLMRVLLEEGMGT